MIKIYLLFTLFSFSFVFSQKRQSINSKSYESVEIIYGNKEPYEQADEFPTLKGDIYSFHKLFHANLDNKQFNKGEKRYYSNLIFIIEKDGSVKEINAEGDDISFNKEVEKAFKKMKNEWTPAKNGLLKVRYLVNVPVQYSEIKYGTNSGGSSTIFGDKKISRTDIFDTVHQRPMYRGKLQDFKEIVVVKVQGIAVNYPFKMSFVVERDGSCTDLKIAGADPNTDEKIKKSILPIEEKWMPAAVEGQKVRSRYTITFP